MYTAPISEIAFTLSRVAGLDDLRRTGTFDDLSADTLEAVLSEAGRFAGEQIAPLAAGADREGAAWSDGAVSTPAGFKALYEAWVAAGWNGLSGPSAHGGQDLPVMLSVAVQEMWNSACLGFAVGPMLTTGAVEALHRHGSDALKAVYLDKLVSGEWTGTMNLTEPQAGSDLNALKSRAERGPDGTYRIFGQKIYITYGEHDLTDNIVHLVLARLPDAPAGTRGISLFLVPKFLPNDDGTPGARNDVVCAGIEHKLGIHAAPTCTMIYGEGRFGDEPGAVGWLVGEENKGLACMFTMMNNARLAVGMQGVGIAEAAYQQAFAYARERRQGRAADKPKGGKADTAMSPIVAHPDVQRMLLTMQALTCGARAIAYNCAHAMDMAKVSEGEASAAWQARADLLTPVAKAFATDIGVEVASLGIQVHGGMGYIEETGAARLLRDARIAPIYEGTNGIQAIDLAIRKLPLSNGAAVAAYLADLRAVADAVGQSNRADLPGLHPGLVAALDALEAATNWMLDRLKAGETQAVLAGATPYLRLLGLAASGIYLAKAALADEESAERALCARFAAGNLIGETESLARVVADGGASLLAAGETLAEP